MIPEVSVIIPSFDGARGGNLSKLLDDLKKQSFKDYEVIVITGISPNGRARNEGVKKAQGEILVFMDDDAVLGTEQVIENLIKPFESDGRIGMTGSAILVPPQADWLQRRWAKLRPTFEAPMVEQITDSDLAQHTCCALPAKVYKEVGWESDDLITGTDNDLRQRLHQAGYRVVLVPQAWVYHIPPKKLKKIIKACFHHGVGAAYALQKHPEMFGYPVVLGFYRIKTSFGSLIYRIITLFLKFIINLITLRPIRLIFELFNHLGFIRGWFKYLNTDIHK